MECEFVGLKNVCNAAKNNKVKKIIYSSSSGVYGKLNYKLNVKEEVAVAPILLILLLNDQLNYI